MQEKDWARGTLKEVPFWRKDMQPEEYDYERSYLHQNWENYTNGKYIHIVKFCCKKTEIYIIIEHEIRN